MPTRGLVRASGEERGAVAVAATAAAVRFVAATAAATAESVGVTRADAAPIGAAPQGGPGGHEKGEAGAPAPAEGFQEKAFRALKSYMQIQ